MTIPIQNQPAQNSPVLTPTSSVPLLSLNLCNACLMFSSVNVCFDNSASWEGGSGSPKNHHTKSSIVLSAFSTPVVIWNTCVPASEPGKKISIPSYSIRVDLLFPRLGTSGFHLQVGKMYEIAISWEPLRIHCCNTCNRNFFLFPKLCAGRDWKNDVVFREPSVFHSFIDTDT